MQDSSYAEIKSVRHSLQGHPQLAENRLQLPSAKEFMQISLTTIGTTIVSYSLLFIFYAVKNDLSRSDITTSIVLIGVLIVSWAALFNFYKGYVLRLRLKELRSLVRLSLQSTDCGYLDPVIKLRTQFSRKTTVIANAAIVDEWARFIKSIPFNKPMSEASIRSLAKPMRKLGIDSLTWVSTGAFDRIMEFYAYEDIASGNFRFPIGLNLAGIPILLSSNEKLVFRYERISLVKNVNHREYSGYSSGYSVRVGKRGSVHSSSYSGTATTVNQKESVDCGQLYITNQAVIFIGVNTPRFDLHTRKLSPSRS
jgi:hypothetical protein